MTVRFWVRGVVPLRLAIEKVKMRTAKCKMKSWGKFDVRRATRNFVRLGHGSS
jgi:hypothetical protein